MKDDQGNPEPRKRLLPSVAVVLLALLLFGLAYRWVSSASSTGGASSGSDDALLAPADTQTTVETAPPDVGVAPPPAAQETSAPPPMPTAEATAALTATPLPTPEFSNPELDDYRQLAAAWEANLVVSDLSNTGLWQFAEDTLVHPFALETAGGMAYLIDSGRVMAINLQDAASLHLLLAPGDDVEGVTVLEPLDLALAGNFLFVLDRAGDVYRYNLNERIWQLDRYDRPIEESSGHYFVALAAAQNEGQTEPERTLLETNYKFAQIYDSENSRIWRLPELRSIDIEYADGDAYVLQRGLHDQIGSISKYRDTSSISSFRPRIEIEEPRQVIAAADGINVLDKGGRRLLLFDPQYGTLMHILQLSQDEPVTAVAVDKESGTILLAGQDRLYFIGRPDERIAVGNGSQPVDLQAHDSHLLARLNDFVVPVGGSNITFRDFQLPGAPRHYRLGVHKGLDFYWQPGTKVVAAGDGTVIRADSDYVEPTVADLAGWYAETSEQGYTPADVLDNYMGRQVWIEHEPGIVSRYAHLRSIEPGIETGVSVSRGQPVGEVGNSGSPASLESESADAHLHYELWLGETYLGQYLRPVETRNWIERIFPTSR